MTKLTDTSGDTPNGHKSIDIDADLHDALKDIAERNETTIAGLVTDGCCYAVNYPHEVR